MVETFTTEELEQLLIKEQFDLYETAMGNYDELADFSLEDLE